MERPLEVDHRADIYSLGVVFYEMLTGELPIGRFDPPSRKVIVDVRLDEVVLRTLQKEPGRRYQHVSDVSHEVEHISGTSSHGPMSDVRHRVRAAKHWCRDRLASLKPATARGELREPTSDVEVVQRGGGVREFLSWLGNRLSAGGQTFCSSVRPGEFFIALVATGFFVFGMVQIADSRRDDDIAVGFLAAVFAFAFARGVMGRIDSWEDLRPAQWLILPPLAAGYLALALLLLIWPGVMMALFGAAPLVIDVDPAWSFFGEDFVDPTRADQIPRYWTLIVCCSLTTLTAWWIGLSLLAKIFPRTFCVVFHPGTPAQVRTVATYVILLAVFGLAPCVALLWSLVAIQ
ncbi:MAG: serine/threonine-protein kinase [Planctomycetota bacterium]|jgi:hypothetical protein